jgi:hypothetical protein
MFLRAKTTAAPGLSKSAQPARALHLPPAEEAVATLRRLSLAGEQTTEVLTESALE